MSFDAALWDSSDPEYAPCLRWQGKGGSRPYWVAPAKYQTMGYLPKRITLDPKMDQVERAALCRKFTREMVSWAEGEEQSPREPGTWGWLIGRYRGDEFSPYKEVQAGTRKGYDEDLAKLERSIGDAAISSMNHPTLKQIELTMRKKGRSDDYVYRWFNVLRRVANYGVVIEDPAAHKVTLILSKMRIKKPPPRYVAANRNQVAAVVAEADRAGHDVFALGLLMMFWWSLRAVDVRGETVDGEWSKGMTWEMIDTPDFTTLRKVISKTARSMPEPQTFRLESVPEIRARLIERWEGLAPEDRTGPIMISDRSKLPYTIYGWSQAWRRLADRAGIPRNVQLRDTRAGAITEAGEMVDNDIDVRNAAQHMDGKTTQLYLRNRDASIDRVVQIRQRNVK